MADVLYGWPRRARHNTAGYPFLMVVLHLSPISGMLHVLSLDRAIKHSDRLQPMSVVKFLLRLQR